MVGGIVVVLLRAALKNNGPVVAGPARYGVEPGKRIVRQFSLKTELIMDKKFSVKAMAKAADNRFRTSTGGFIILNAILILSGFLSAIFFWEHSAKIFDDIPSLLAAFIGLTIGTLPAEFSFWGWERIRATKEDMTVWQIWASKYGMWLGVFFAIFNIIAIFVTSFDAVPQGVKDLSIWIVFLALVLPIPAQLLFVAIFKTNEQAVLEATARAKIHALQINATIQNEKARIEAEIAGMEKALEAELNAYGAAAGRSKASKFLRDGFDETAESTHDDVNDLFEMFELFMEAQRNAPAPAAASRKRKSALEWMKDQFSSSGYVNNGDDDQDPT